MRTISVVVRLNSLLSILEVSKYCWEGEMYCSTFVDLCQKSYSPEIVVDSEGGKEMNFPPKIEEGAQFAKENNKFVNH